MTTLLAYMAVAKSANIHVSHKQVHNATQAGQDLYLIHTQTGEDLYPIHTQTDKDLYSVHTKTG